ncbi:MAG: Gfo/Idh/MocA family oxidoreductase [Clostridia bacterium]|nr:Gfo/Idh/MocA family oxidoreductase [Clostridia bacterium]
MIRIGIVGSDNSHALAFSKICNLCDENGNYEYDDVRITAIYGFNDDPEHTLEVAKEGNIPFVAKSIDEMFDKIDAVMVVCRDGKYHLGHILPFMEKGYPVWIDKPIVTSREDAKALYDAAKKYGVLVTGGSTMKYNYETLTLQNKIKSGQLGNITGGFMNFPGNLASEYSGLHFYGPHLLEMCLSVFGYDAKSVQAHVLNDGNITVTVFYDDKNVNLNFNGKTGGKYYGLVLGDKNSVVCEFDLSVIYKLGFDRFIKMLKTGKMPLTLDELLKPVYMLNSILDSIKENKKIDI